MKLCVLDTSALLRLYIPDGPIAPNSETLLEEMQAGDLLIYAPELILVEVAQVLLKKEKAHFLNPSEVKEIEKEIFLLPLELASHRDLVESASQVARKFRLSIYDALYVALAQKLKCPLITCDKDLAKACL